ncbi:MAG: lipid II flippase MurJ [bacterium]
MSLGTAGLGLAFIRAMNSGLGLLLSIALAAVFGVNREVDALFVAMSVAVFLARDLSRVIRTAAVPCLVESDEGGGAPGFATSLHITVVAIALGVTVIVWCGAPIIVKLISPGFDHTASHEAGQLLRLLAPSLLMFLLFGSAQSVFHARHRFWIPELSETLWRILAIGALFTVGRQDGIKAYAEGLTVAAFAQWGFIFLAASWYGLRVLPVRLAPIRMDLLKPFWLGAVVVLCSVIQMQIEGVLDRAVISFMAPGSIALFTYADRLAHMMPILLSTSLLTPWLPAIAKIQAQVGDPRRLAKQGSLFLAALGTLLAVVIAWGARDMVAFLLLRGKFDAFSADIVIVSVQIFTLGIPAIFCVQCLAGLFIVSRDLKAMIHVGLLAVITHAIFNLLLLPWGVPGIALSGSLAIWVVAIYLWRRIPTKEQVWFPWGRFTGAIAAVFVVLYAVPWPLFLIWAPVRLTAGAVAAWAVYTAIMWPAILRMQAYEREATGQTIPVVGNMSDRKILKS